MVWPMETIDPLVAISSRVARNDVAVARRRDQRGMIGLALQIDHESRHRGEDRGCIETFGKFARQRLGTAIDSEVEIEQPGRTGSASCRSRVCTYGWISVGSASLKKKYNKYY